MYVNLVYSQWLSPQAVSRVSTQRPALSGKHKTNFNGDLAFNILTWQVKRLITSLSMFLVGFMVVKISINNGAFWPTFIMDPGGGVKGG